MTFLSDVEKLRKDPSVATRQNVTEKVTQYFNQGIFDQQEANLAIEVMTLLAHDAEVEIRKTLSENLKNNDAIPHALALRLAEDVIEVSLPMLEVSTLLSQEDLIKIVKKTKEMSALTAIASRNDVSAPLSGALIDTNHEKVIDTLVNNEKAVVNENHMKEVLAKFPKSGAMIEALVSRGSLPVSIVDQMLEAFLQKFTDDPQPHVIQNIVEALKKHNVEEEKAAPATDPNNHHSADDEYRRTLERVDQLHKKNELTSSMILRALCKGDFNFLEIGLGKLTDSTPERVHKILYSQGPTIFAALYKKAGMPEGTFGAVNVIWEFVLEELTTGTFNKATYANRMLEYITENGYDSQIEFMQYFMILFKSKANDDEMA